MTSAMSSVASARKIRLKGLTRFLLTPISFRKGVRIMTSFESNIKQYFPYLFERLGFKFIDLENDYDGNVVVARSDRLRIRFIKDRADFFLDIGRVEEPDRWIGLYKIIDRLNAEGHVHTGYKYSNKISPVSRLLEQYFPEIQKYFSNLDSGRSY